MNTENLMNLTLTHGSHGTREEGMCLMEAVAFLGGEEHSDHPECSCPILAAFARTLNDRMGRGTEGDALRAKHLLPLATKLVGTRSTPEVERKRAFYFADRSVRLFAPSALEAAGLTEEAETLRSLPEIVDEQHEQSARAAYAAARAAWAAYDAADAADAAAYRAAAVASAAYDAARAAAYAAADASAGAYAAADAAADAAAWAQAAKVLSEACEINLDGGE